MANGTSPGILEYASFIVEALMKNRWSSVTRGPIEVPTKNTSVFGSLARFIYLVFHVLKGVPVCN
jgi:hypothetical protein